MGPTHFPPYFGGGLVQVRSRVLVPLPQVFEHFDQAAQFDQRPFTGHLFSRQGFICLLGPTHFPPYFGGGLVQVRSRVLVPFPQTLEHFVQADQFDQRPFTGHLFTRHDFV